MAPPSTADQRQIHQQMRQNEEDEQSGDEGVEELDGKQVLQQRVELRTGLRGTIAETAEARKNATNLDPSQVMKMVEQGNKTFNTVDRPQEALLDAAAFKLQSEMGAQQAKAMKVDQNAFDTGFFLNSIQKAIGSKRMRDEDSDDGEPTGDWGALGWLGVEYSARVCLPDFLLGPLAVPLKQRTVQKRAKLVRDEAAKTKPKEIEKNGDQDQKETTRYAIEINDILVHAITKYQLADPSHEGRGINFFEFVINPFSFSQTIENIFYVSFNIKEGKACLDVEESSLLTIMSTDPADPGAADEGVTKLQMVLEIDQELYRDAIETFGIRTCLHIPNREVSADAR